MALYRECMETTKYFLVTLYPEPRQKLRRLQTMLKKTYNDKLKFCLLWKTSQKSNKKRLYQLKYDNKNKVMKFVG
jgi:hypothetical protein